MNIQNLQQEVFTLLTVKQEVIIHMKIQSYNHNITMPMYNLIEYSDNYSNPSGSLWQFKRDELEENVDLTVDGNHILNNSSSYKYKSSFITSRNNVKIAVPLKYLSNFWRSLEMPLINCKVELSLTWDPNCILTSLAADSTFTITQNFMFLLLLYQQRTMQNYQNY